MSLRGNRILFSRLACAVAFLLLTGLGTAAAQAPSSVSGSFGSFGGVITDVTHNLRLLSSSSCEAAEGRSGNTWSTLTGGQHSPADLCSGIIGLASDLRQDCAIALSTNAFRMIGMPVLNTGYNEVVSVFGGIGGVDYVHNWKVGHWNNSTGDYGDVVPGKALEMGQGYWVVNSTDKTAHTRGLPLPAEDFHIALGASADGWNQLSNPFSFSVAAQDLQVSDGTNTWDLLDSSNPVADAQITVWTGSYVHPAGIQTVDPLVGFWVHRKSTSGSAWVIVPAKASAPHAAPQVSARLAAADWAVGVTATEDEMVAIEPLALGQTSGVQNKFTDLAAPAPPGAALRLTLHSPQARGGSPEYTAEIRPAADVQDFDFVMTGARAPGEVNLTFDRDRVPADSRLVLTDLGTGSVTEIGPSGRVSVLARDAAQPYRLSVIAIGATGSEGRKYADGVQLAYPNPFQASTGVAFTLAHEGNANIDLYDIGGRGVQSTVMRGLAGGQHVWVWNGADNEGREQGSGVYFARWRVGGAQGVLKLVKVN